MRRTTRDALAVCMIIALIAGGFAVYSMYESGKVKEEILLMAAKRDLAGLRDDLAVRSPNDHYPEVVLAARIILERESRSSLFENQEIYYRRQPVRKQGSRQILLIARLGSRHFEVPNLGEIHSHYRDFVFQKHDYVRIGIRNRG